MKLRELCFVALTFLLGLYAEYLGALLAGADRALLPIMLGATLGTITAARSYQSHQSDPPTVSVKATVGIVMAATYVSQELIFRNLYNWPTGIGWITGSAAFVTLVPFVFMRKLGKVINA